MYIFSASERHKVPNSVWVKFGQLRVKSLQFSHPWDRRNFSNIAERQLERHTSLMCKQQIEVGEMLISVLASKMESQGLQ